MCIYATILPGLRSTALSTVAAVQRRWMCVGACLLLAVPAYAVEPYTPVQPDPVLEPWRWTTFDQTSGLAGGVHDIYEDREGNVWIATDRGAQKYDGYRWTTYTTEDGLGHNQVNVIIQDRDAAMWFGTNGGGVSRFQPGSDSEQAAWTTWTDADGLPGNVIGMKALTQTRDGAIWVGANEGGDAEGVRSGLGRFDGESWIRVDIPFEPTRPSVMSLFESSGGSLWVSTWYHGILRYDPSMATGEAGWTLYDQLEGVAIRAVWSTSEANDGSLWFPCFGDRRILRLTPTGGGVPVWQSYTTEDGLPNALFISTWQARDGSIWASGKPGRLSRFDGTRWHAYAAEDLPQLRGDFLCSTTSDGAFWFFELAGDRIERLDYSGTRWRTFEFDEPLSQFEADNAGNLWLGTRTGALRYDGTTWLRFGPEDGLLDARVRRIELANDGSMWFLAGERRRFEGATRHDSGSWQRYAKEQIGLDGLGRGAFASTSDGTVWLAGSKEGTGAAARYDPGSKPPPGQAPGSWRSYKHQVGGFESLGRTTLDPSGDVWFIAGERRAEKGLLRFDGNLWTSYTTADGLLHDRVEDIVRHPDGTIWVGTLGGMSRFDPSTPLGTGGGSWHNTPTVGTGSTPRNFTVFRGDLWWGYVSPNVGVTANQGGKWRTYAKGDGFAGYRVFVDADSTLWGYGSGGLTRFDGIEVGANYTVEDGLPGSINSMTQTRDGAFWFRSGNEKIASFAPDEEGPKTEIIEAPSEVSSVGNILVRWSGGDRWEQTARKDLRYRYRLDEGEWTPMVDRTDVTFTALSPGSHQIEVQARDLDGNLDTTPAFHAFVVESPWWRNPVVAGPGLLIIAFALFQSARVVLAKRKLQDSVDALSSANNELFQVNVDLQREQVLERLRGQAQGMQSSEDIKPVVEAVYRELAGLGLPLTNSAINIYLTETEVERWPTDNDGHALEPIVAKRPPDRPAEEAGRRGEDYVHFEGESQQSYFVNFEGGNVRLSSTDPITEDYLMLIKRFGEVFGYAHSRYKELQEKEAQNQELKNQNVLERLRGQAQGMQSSEDIEPVVEAVYRELKQLGLPLFSLGINVHLSDTEREAWGVALDGRAQEPRIHKRDPENPASKARRRGDDYVYSYTENEDARNVIRQSIEAGNPRWRDVPEERWPQEHHSYIVLFEGGGINLSSEEAISEEYLLLTKRFGDVFGYAYSRHKELQEKEGQNRHLAVDASVQRLRAEVQSMDEASDFERILSLLTESLKTVELTFDGCEIDVLDEPVENPTIDLFEANGFRYATYTLDTDGHVTVEAFAVAAPFPGVIRQTVERFIAGEPWQGQSEGEAIVEVPAGSYGRLRLTASGRDSFTEDEVATLREFADAVALGYARYLDIREIQVNTERKSAFLASMSHELRTPMNAIKGFTNLVLGRRSENLNDQQRENLGKVSQASDHLLGMIDDLLDLSKIEAGSMDVNATMFNVGELIASACDTVSPLIQEGVELRQDVAVDTGEANTDKARVQQMVINLLSNAIKFTDSGSVRVRAERVSGSGANGREDLVISVSDTGKGIPVDELPTIFDEYRQAEGSESSVQKGTGLGLSITRKFAELLGGSVSVRSELGTGSTFTVTVPTEYAGPSHEV